MTEIHHRMPLILHREKMENWLFSKEAAERMLDGHFIPVSNESKSCLQ